MPYKAALTVALAMLGLAGAEPGFAQAFMDDEKRILVFADAGGTGRS